MVEQLIIDINNLITNHLLELFKAQLEWSKHLSDSDMYPCKMYYFDKVKCQDLG